MKKVKKVVSWLAWFSAAVIVGGFLGAALSHLGPSRAQAADTQPRLATSLAWWTAERDQTSTLDLDVQIDCTSFDFNTPGYTQCAATTAGLVASGQEKRKSVSVHDFEYQITCASHADWKMPAQLRECSDWVDADQSATAKVSVDTWNASSYQLQVDGFWVPLDFWADSSTDPVLASRNGQF